MRAAQETTDLVVWDPAGQVQTVCEMAIVGKLSYLVPQFPITQDGQLYVDTILRGARTPSHEPVETLDSDHSPCGHYSQRRRRW